MNAEVIPMYFPDYGPDALTDRRRIRLSGAGGDRAEG